jgi:hypothetical protein
MQLTIIRDPKELHAIPGQVWEDLGVFPFEEAGKQGSIAFDSLAAEKRIGQFAARLWWLSQMPAGDLSKATAGGGEARQGSKR